MISTSDFKKGVRVEYEGQPCLVVDVSTHSPTARGSNTLVKVRFRNILTGRIQDCTFKAGEKFEEPDVQYKKATYLYRDESHLHFMDSDTYEQFSLTPEILGEDVNFLMDNLEVKAIFYQDRAAAIELPNTLDIPIAECEPGVRGDTVSAVTKPATLVTGAVVQVPLFVEPGTTITVDTRDGRYLRRAN